MAFCYKKYHIIDKLLPRVYLIYGIQGVFMNNYVCKMEQMCQIVSKNYFEKK